MTARSRALLAALAGAGLAAVAARGAYQLLTKRPPGGTASWARTNHRGEAVTLLEGAAVVAGAALAAAAAPGLPGRARAGLMAAAAGAGAFGGYDDLAGRGGPRGFRGHLGALARGGVTTGAVKLGGIGATGLTASALLGGGPADVLINAGLIAGGANVLNLFDLRPGRAIKVAAAGGTLLAAAAPGQPGSARQTGPADQAGRAGRDPARSPAAPLAAVPLGAALALLREDLAERAMLGDAGANTLGAMLGTAAAASLPRPARIAVLAGIAGLTAASEVVSFTKVIERTPPLRWLDMLGRRPAAAPAVGERPAGPVAGPAPAATEPGTRAPASP